ncbi:hypothetical protein LTS14_005420 [Recurvomyces mirabilis]|uniref:uncharacterized protein n=1 Tax=Recurvomyces mirabilis TaxID=574656 RepID=UPI002DE12E23|nr:hypothetical protein LTS14_005420 [Recurvomyces mirabilis]
MEALQRMEGALQRQTQHAWMQARMLLAIMVFLHQLGSKLQTGVAGLFLLHGQLKLMQKSIEAIPDRMISQSLACFVDANGRPFTLDTRLTWTWKRGRHAKTVHDCFSSRLRDIPGALETAFYNLTSSQQSVVTNVIQTEGRLEKIANAEWILADVHRYGPTCFGQLVDVTKIRVILQRRNRQEGTSA